MFQTSDLMASVLCSCSFGKAQLVPRQLAGSFAPRILCRALRRGGHRNHNGFAFIRSSSLLGKKCNPCEPDTGSLGLMGMCEALSRDQAESMLVGEVCCLFCLTDSAA